MPRRPRLIYPGAPLHLIQRGNNRQACFFSDDDYHCYLDWLRQYAGENDCLIHAYVLMTNHVHLLMTPGTAEAAGALMKRLGQRYVQYVNRTYRRSGTLWEGRFRSCLTQKEDYVLSCTKMLISRYGESLIGCRRFEYRGRSSQSVRIPSFAISQKVKRFPT
jgi:putative transposase